MTRSTKRSFEFFRVEDEYGNWKITSPAFPHFEHLAHSEEDLLSSLEKEFIYYLLLHVELGYYIPNSLKRNFNADSITLDIDPRTTLIVDNIASSFNSSYKQSPASIAAQMFNSGEVARTKLLENPPIIESIHTDGELCFSTSVDSERLNSLKGRLSFSVLDPGTKKRSCIRTCYSGDFFIPETLHTWIFQTLINTISDFNQLFPKMDYDSLIVLGCSDSEKTKQRVFVKSSEYFKKNSPYNAATT